jgi:hypothetical protein
MKATTDILKLEACLHAIKEIDPFWQKETH